MPLSTPGAAAIRQPLKDLRVLDLSRVLAGPLCSMMLGDLGAEVIKVERPRTGDETRGWGPPFDSRGESAYYLSVNRNKKSVSADLDMASDRAMIIDLIDEADIVIDNFRRGTLERRGISPDDLVARHPRLIWCTITGFGPESDRAGYDLVVQAESGWMSITGEPGGDPMRVGVALADIIAGKDAAIAILAALTARGLRPDSEAGLSSEERRIHISLAHSAIAALVNVAQNSLVTGKDARRWGNEHPNLVPYQLFHAADRPMIVAVGTDAQWIACATVLGLDDLATDASLALNAGRLAQRKKIIEAMSRRLLERHAEAWIELLSKRGVPCGVVKSVLESLEDVTASPLSGIAPGVPGTVRLPPPRLDEHGDEIRRDGWRVFR
ncbi:MAG: CaiB/BaiF CoA transferase family protein [Gemmatimonadaceae bacterium]